MHYARKLTNRANVASCFRVGIGTRISPCNHSYETKMQRVRLVTWNRSQHSRLRQKLYLLCSIRRVIPPGNWASTASNFRLGPRKKLASDFAGKFLAAPTHQRCSSVVIDYYRNRPEAATCGSLTSAAVIAFLTGLFDWFGPFTKSIQITVYHSSL